jgi:phosphinothricin acetyltransferase
MLFFRDRRYRTFSILEDGALCGYVLINRFHGREGWDKTAEVTIYLKPDSCGNGIGSSALRHIEAFAESAGIHVLVASICAENLGSIRLLKRTAMSPAPTTGRRGISSGGISMPWTIRRSSGEKWL